MCLRNCGFSEKKILTENPYPQFIADKVLELKSQRSKVKHRSGRFLSAIFLRRCVGVLFTKVFVQMQITSRILSLSLCLCVLVCSSGRLALH